MRLKPNFLLVFCLLVTLLMSTTTFACPVPMPATITPNVSTNNQMVDVKISGQKFSTKLLVKLTQNGQEDIVATNVKRVSAKEITCSFDLNGKAPGKWSLIVANVSKLTKKVKPQILVDAFTISHSAPTVTDVSVSLADGLNQQLLLNVNGTNFRPGAQVKVSATGKADIMAKSVEVVSASNLTSLLDLNDTPTAEYDLTVTNDDQQSATLKNAFKVKQVVITKPSPTPTPTPEPVVTPTPTVDPNTALKAIFFDYDKHQIRENQMKTLQANLNVLKANSSLFIVLGGHADERGSAKYNLVLSAKRAEEVKNFLIKNGIDENRIILYAYGKDFPAKDGHTEEYWWYNRRVDISLWETKPSKDQALRENTEM